MEESLADAEAAERFAEANVSIETAHVYALGHGSGGDLALASAASGNERELLAGIGALAPMTIAYRERAKASRPPADVCRKVRSRTTPPPLRGAATIRCSSCILASHDVVRARRRS